MKHKLLRASAIVLILVCVGALGACTQQFVDEDRAEQAGLALMRQAFGVCARSAHVEYFERAGSSVIDNSDVSAENRAPDQIYLVTISDQTLGIDLYYAEVDAKSGIAYYASQSEWVMTPLNSDQIDLSNQINQNADENDADSFVQSDDSAAAAGHFMVHQFKKEVALISAHGCCRRDTILSPRVGIGYFVTLADGALYRVGFSWPTMELKEVEDLGNELEVEH